MPLVAHGAYKLTGDSTRFKESYTADHPLLPPPVAPPFYLPVFRSPPQVRYDYIEEGHDYAEDCYAYNGPPCLPLPPLLSHALRFAMSTPRIAMSTPRNAQAAFRFRQRPPYNDFLRRGPRLFDPPHIGFAIVVLGRSPLPAYG